MVVTRSKSWVNLRSLVTHEPEASTYLVPSNKHSIKALTPLLYLEVTQQYVICAYH